MWLVAFQGIRKLTDDEKARIKAAKQAANDTIKARRKAIQKEMKGLEKGDTVQQETNFKTLEEQLEELKPITGNPVYVFVNGGSVCLNYDTVKKLDWSLRRVSRNMQVQPGLRLTIEYPTGVVELYELPAYQVALLSNFDLPVIEL